MRAKGLFCNDLCRDSFQTDRRYGLIYGPYRYEDGTFAMTWEEASERDRFCAYDRVDLSDKGNENG